MKERDDGYLIETEQLNADVVREYELKKGVNQSGENNVRMRIYDSANTRLLDYRVNSAKNLTGKKAKITWSVKKDVDGYQVQIALDKGFKKGKKTKTITSKLVKNYTFTKLKKKKTYYARVWTYKLLGGNKIYSDWSTSKKFIIKK
ncbi:MAG: hypothetical protein IJD40_09215 [Lachnospiraceae bacterium]|nr:hypothetical protein [Lachnospiraceae bacterium]